MNKFFKQSSLFVLTLYGIVLVCHIPTWPGTAFPIFSEYERFLLTNYYAYTTQCFGFL